MALEAVAHCWKLYAYAPDDGDKAAAKSAARSCVAALQQKHRNLARELIAWAMNWEDRDRLWPTAASKNTLLPFTGRALK